MKTRVTLENVVASGRRRGWTKHVTSVDESKSNGYAFDGDFLNDGLHELEVGSVIVQKNPMGSAKNGWYAGRVGIIEPDGSIRWTLGDVDWRKHFLLIRDAVVDALKQASSNDPRQEAIEQIKSLIAKHGITPEEIC